MAINVFLVKPISRGKGMDGIGKAAYQSGEKLIYNSKVYNYSGRNDILHKEIFLPDNAPETFFDRQTLWSEAEKAEKRKDSRTAREILIPLARELSTKSNIGLVKTFIEEHLLAHGICADLAIHRGDSKSKKNSDEDQARGLTEKRLHNPHAHILIVTRAVNPHGFERLKARHWDKPEFIIAWRDGWEYLQNKLFERKGLNVRISYRSYKKQGIDREPTKHLGPVFAALERKGVRTRLGDVNREIEARNKAFEERDKPCKLRKPDRVRTLEK